AWLFFLAAPQEKAKNEKKHREGQLSSSPFWARDTSNEDQAAAELFIVANIFQPPGKWATMSGVTPWVKRAIWLLVIYGILYVLISPLPEMAAALSGRSVLIFILPATCALLDLFLLVLVMYFRCTCSASRASNVLEMICLRLC
ncbi:MAG: hypothetical protein ACRD4I_10475, partial [Candidatus Angelobacter sp.]